MRSRVTPRLQRALGLLVALSVVAGCGGAAATNTPAATAAATTADAALAATGATEAQSLGCLGCHTIDGTQKVGPTWQGLYGSQVTLTDGSTVLVDDAYLRDSIANPDAQVVQGFQPGVMPKVGSTLTADQLSSLVAYIETLGTP